VPESHSVLLLLLLLGAPSPICFLIALFTP